MIDTSIKYSGISLLDKIFEFIEMTPNSAEWNVKSLKANPPRLIRLRQIESLLKAFFGTNRKQNLLTKAKSMLFADQAITINTFLQGHFIMGYSIDEYTALTNSIKDSVRNRAGSNQQKEMGVEELVSLFLRLIKFKKQVRGLVTFNSTWLEASSDVSLFSIYLTNTVAENLCGKYKELDDIIEQLINPKGLIFSTKELIGKFDFPTEDLSEIVIDFM
jgi:hypothetical protein